MSLCEGLVVIRQKVPGGERVSSGLAINEMIESDSKLTAGTWSSAGSWSSVIRVRLQPA